MSQQGNQAYQSLLPVHAYQAEGGTNHVCIGLAPGHSTDTRISGPAPQNYVDHGLYSSNQRYQSVSLNENNTNKDMMTNSETSTHHHYTEDEDMKKKYFKRVGIGANTELFHGRCVSIENQTQLYQGFPVNSVTKDPAVDKSPNSFAVSKDNQAKNQTECCEGIIGNTKVECYRCGACNVQFDKICKLHNHLLSHQASRSYTYNVDTKTAYPKYDAICRAVQTFDIDDICEQRDVDLTGQDEQQVGQTDEGANLKIDQEEVKKTGPLDDTLQTKRISKRSKQKVMIKNGFDEMIKGKSRTKRNKESLDKNNDSSSLQEEVYNQTTGLLISDSCVSKPAIDTKVNTNLEDEKNDRTLKTTDIDSDSSESDFSDLDTTNFNTERNIKAASGTKKDKVYNCTDCGKSYKFQSGLNHHRLVKHEVPLDGDESKVPYECRWCHETFQMKKTLLNHAKVCSKNERLKCFICDEAFTSRSDRLKHLQSHENRPDLTCRLCGKMATSLKLLQAHIKRHHQPKTIQCDQCGRSFQYQHLLNKHLVCCNNERPVKCTKCDMRFKTDEAMKHHLSVHSEDKPYVCQYCGYAGKKLNYLKRHIRSHTGERPYSCRICGLSFTGLNGLNRHNKIHTNTKKCVCKYCGKTFTNNWNLKTHLRQHTGDTPYTCSECGKSFKQNVLVKLHMKSHHPYL